MKTEKDAQKYENNKFQSKIFLSTSLEIVAERWVAEYRGGVSGGWFFIWIEGEKPGKINRRQQLEKAVFPQAMLSRVCKMIYGASVSLISFSVVLQIFIYDTHFILFFPRY